MSHPPSSLRKTDAVLIFGAGASFGATECCNALPLQNQLINRMLRLNVTEGRISKDRRTLQAYLKSVYPSRESFDDVAYEEIVGPLEWLESQDSAYHLGVDGMRNQHTLSALDHLLAFVLTRPNFFGRFVPHFTQASSEYEKSLYRVFYEMDEGSPNAYARLFAKLANSASEIGVVSFNYDLLLDRVLLHHSSKFRIDYQIPFSGRDPADAVDVQRQKVAVVKPHGSLNWAWCTVCRQVTILGTTAVMPQGTCQSCSTDSALVPLLIRPSFIKDLRGRVWRAVLESGQRMLALADTWIFVGYSLPASDYWVRAWLLSALLRRSNEPVQVVLVDPDPSGAVRRRYLEFLGSDVMHIKTGFYQFADDFSWPLRR
jgi:hypothetical protein